MRGTLYYFSLYNKERSDVIVKRFLAVVFIDKYKKRYYNYRKYSGKKGDQK